MREDFYSIMTFTSPLDPFTEINERKSGLFQQVDIAAEAYKTSVK
jgi:hypothetical protein